MRHAFVCALVLVCSAAIRPALADVDTEHMFGFSEGTDIGEPFQAEGELETVGRFGKDAGSYAVVTTTANLKYTLSDEFRIAPSIAFASYSIAGVPGFSDTSEFVFDHAALEFRWHPIARETHPVGLTFVATPFFGTVDPATGERADDYGIQFIAALDRTIVAERLYAAINVLYALDRNRNWATNVTTDSSLLGASLAASASIVPWLYVGAELRYLQGYDGLALASLTDQALYAGPTFYMTLGKGASLSGAWEFQVWGSLTGNPSGLDLVNFERQQFKLRLAVNL
jgi:hypothetical protein